MENARCAQSLSQSVVLVRQAGRQALNRYVVASQWKVRAQHELALETPGLDTAVCVGDLVERDPLGDARLDGVLRQQAEESFQIVSEPGGMTRPHGVDRVEACVLASREKPPEIHPRNRHQNGAHALLRLHTSRETNREKQSARLERCERAAIAILADSVEHDVE